VLTKREEEIYRMSEQGFNPPQIANKKKMGLPNVLRSLDMARKKLAIIRARRDNKKTRSNTQAPGS
jgi:DNA-binding CsgD family transcriptional regulator